MASIRTRLFVILLLATQLSSRRGFLGGLFAASVVLPGVVSAQGVDPTTGQVFAWQRIAWPGS